MQDNTETPSRHELKEKLRSKIGEKSIQRSNKKNKDKFLEESFKDLGIDKEKFLEDLKKLKNKED